MSGNCISQEDFSGTLAVTFEREADESAWEKGRNAETVLSPGCAGGHAWAGVDRDRQVCVGAALSSTDLQAR